MARRKILRQGWLESYWKPLLEQAPAGRARRKGNGRQTTTVLDMSVSDGWLTARVKATGYRTETHRVRIPCVAWWRPYIADTAKWLSRRPEWHAALLAGEWDSTWVDFLENAGLRLYPDEAAAQRILAESTCTCGDVHTLCQHVVAVIGLLVRESEGHSLHALRYVGVDNEELMGLAHSVSVVASEEYQGLNTVEWDSVQSEALWAEERLALQLSSHVEDSSYAPLAPLADKERWEAWKSRYMAWE